MLLSMADKLMRWCCVLAGSRVLILMAGCITSITTLELLHGNGLCLYHQGICSCSVRCKIPSVVYCFHCSGTSHIWMIWKMSVM